VKEIPGGAMSFEPKWDGFRSIVFRDGDEVEIGSRNERPMTRYFPEVAEAIMANLPERCVVDGEIVVPIPPAASGVRDAPAADPPRGQPGQAARGADAPTLGGLRPARPRRPGPHAEPFAERRRALEGALSCQGQARPNRRLRRRRLQGAQDRQASDGVTAARPARARGLANVGVVGAFPMERRRAC
jgi:hypothetical protein